MLPSAFFLNDAAAGAGLMAGGIAIGGFLAHARPALAGDGDQAVRAATVIGGLTGLAIAIALGAAGILMQ